MKKYIFLTMFVITCNAVASSPSFLVSEFVVNGERYCRYDNGVVINVGTDRCPRRINVKER